jgi:alcohol dehydrogenase class IV
MVDAAHGAVCAALLAAVVEINVAALRGREPANPAVERYRNAALLLTGSRDASIEDGVDWIRQTVELLGIPGLAELGVRPDMSDDIVSKTRTASSTRGNPIVLTDAELHRVLAQSSV